MPDVKEQQKGDENEKSITTTSWTLSKFFFFLLKARRFVKNSLCHFFWTYGHWINRLNSTKDYARTLKVAKSIDVIWIASQLQQQDQNLEKRRKCRVWGDKPDCCCCKDVNQLSIDLLDWLFFFFLFSFSSFLEHSNSLADALMAAMCLESSVRGKWWSGVVFWLCCPFFSSFHYNFRHFLEGGGGHATLNFDNEVPNNGSRLYSSRRLHHGRVAGGGVASIFICPKMCHPPPFSPLCLQMEQAKRHSATVLSDKQTNEEIFTFKSPRSCDWHPSEAHSDPSPRETTFPRNLADNWVTFSKYGSCQHQLWYFVTFVYLIR